MMQFLIIAAYKFIELHELPALRARLWEDCQALAIKGTILLSHEGINLTLAGTPDAIRAMQQRLSAAIPGLDMAYKDSYADRLPFKRLKVKIKKEIITMRRAAIEPHKTCAPRMTPEMLKQWLDEQREFTLLDTRNGFEVEFGTFKGATHLGLQDFSQFPEASNQLDRHKPVVMFCTGGIRCEKAGLHLLQQGFDEVYQLDGGILNYFAKVGGAHYQGNCFVFDERVAITPDLTVSHTHHSTSDIKG